MADEHGVIGHAELRIGDTVVLAFDTRPDWPDTPRSCASTSRTATRRSAARSPPAEVESREMTQLFWGDRVGRVRDPLGNLWWIQQRVEEVDEAEMGRRMGDPVWLERMAYVTSMDPFAER